MATLVIKKKVPIYMTINVVKNTRDVFVMIVFKEWHIG